MEKSGYIYVLTNESFHRDNWIKIGYAEDVEKRARELSGTAVPLPYEIYCTYEIPRIEGVKDPDKLLHDLITKLNPSLRISPNREFFEMLPWDAYEMLRAIAQMHGRMDKLKQNEQNKSGQDIQTEEECSVETFYPKGSEIRQLYETMKACIMEADPTLLESVTQCYVTFKRGAKHNTVSLWPKSGWIEVVLHAKIGQLNDDAGLIYDISNRRWTSAQYAFKFNQDTDMDVVRDLVKQTLALKR